MASNCGTNSGSRCSFRDIARLFYRSLEPSRKHRGNGTKTRGVVIDAELDNCHISGGEQLKNQSTSIIVEVNYVAFFSIVRCENICPYYNIVVNNYRTIIVNTFLIILTF